MKAIKVLLGCVVLVALCGLVLLALAWRSAIDPIDPAQARKAEPALVERGASLAAIGNCATCHTAPGGKPFAGGLPIPTPFGTIHSTNITPDADTGIGRWSQEAFLRALREGVDRQGHHLYPAFPYDHFTLVTDDDSKALYAYLMTRAPVRAPDRANGLAFPYNIRLAVAGWKLLYFRAGPYKPDTSKPEDWNRGRYLVAGLAHCSSCHTPRNALGAEKKDALFAGGEADGWSAYALDASSPAPVPWERDAFYDYLRHGWQAAHGMARGPMAPVVDNLKRASDADVRAIATYLVSVAGEPSAERKRAGEQLLAQTRRPGAKAAAAPGSADSQKPAGATPDAGATIYAAACATCHESGRPLPYGGMSLALSTALQGPTPRNPINVILDGLPPAAGSRNAIMPGFRHTMTDQQIAALLTYLRASFSSRPAWPDVEAQVRDLRNAKPAPAVEPAPAAPRSANAATSQ